MTKPSGQGMAKGPESADEMGTSLPPRDSRASANSARAPKYPADPASQGGFGTEDMMGDVSHLSEPWTRPQDEVGPPPDLMAMGDPGQTFGGS